MRCVLRSDGDGAPDIVVALGGLVAGNKGLHVHGGAGRGIDIDATAQAVAGGVPLAIGAALRLVAAHQHTLQRRGATADEEAATQSLAALGCRAARAALGHIADDLAIANDKGGRVGEAEKRVCRAGDAAAHRSATRLGATARRRARHRRGTH